MKAYAFGFPAVLMDQSRSVFTGVEHPSPDGAPMNQLLHLDRLPDPSFRAVVRPNRDTLYSSAFLDLSGGPLVLTLPRIPEHRFCMFACMDAWTNAFASIGTRSNDNAPERVVIHGPDGTSDAPEGLGRVRAPTNLVWLLGRIEVFGARDIESVRGLQSQIDLRPLRHLDDETWQAPSGPPPSPDLDRETEPARQVLAMSAQQFYSRLCELLATQPPAADPRWERALGRLGLEPGRLDYEALPAGTRRALERGRSWAQRALDMARDRLSARAGWGPSAKVPLGDYGHHYWLRAVVAQVGFGANRRDDAVYLNTARDDRGQRLDGQHRYALRFGPGGLPPVRAFWSVSLYDPDGYFIDNEIGRYVLGTHDGLASDTDGGLVILVQKDRPAKDEVPRWLPAPDGPFALTLRMYWPTESLVQGGWAPPKVQRL